MSGCSCGNMRKHCVASKLKCMHRANKHLSGVAVETSRIVSSVVNWETVVSEAKFAPWKQKCF